MDKNIAWLKASNRTKHLVGIFLVSLVGSALMGIGCAGGMEFKDVHHANGNKPMKEWTWEAWDWLDMIAGIIGAVLATCVRVLLYILITQ